MKEGSAFAPGLARAAMGSWAAWGVQCLLLCLWAPSPTVAHAQSRLDAQRALQLDTPLHHTQWLSAHNAWNDSGAVWANQRWSIETMLEAGIRAFDLDVHLEDGQAKLCHDSCSNLFAAKDSYEAELQKLARWAQAHPQELIFIDIEDKVGDMALVVEPLKRLFGDMLYRPIDAPAGDWETPRAILARGRRVIVKSANHVYDGTTVWSGRVFAQAIPGYNYQPVKYVDLDRCLQDGMPLDEGLMYGVMDSKIGKGLLPDSWVDDTGTIYAEHVGPLLACGFNFIDADRWNQSMVDAAVWSWAEGEPNNAGGNEDCVVMRGEDGRFNDLGCDAVLPFACVDAREPLVFGVTAQQGRFAEGDAACASEFPGTRFSLPHNAHEHARLRAVAGGRAVWLNLTDAGREGHFELRESAVDSWHSERGEALHESERFAVLRRPEAAALLVSVVGDAAAAEDYVRIYDLERRLIRELRGHLDVTLTVEGGGIIVERAAFTADHTPGEGVVVVEVREQQLRARMVYRQLRNGNGRCLDLKGRRTDDGTPVHQWSCHDASSQKWAMDELGRLHSLADPTKCLDVEGAKDARGTRVILYACHEGANQRFIFSDATGLTGTGRLRPQHNTQRTLDIKDSAWGSFDGQRAHLWDVHGGQSQRWRWID